MTKSEGLSAILQAVMRNSAKAAKDKYYPRWHLAPITGLLNDPNGFCFDGKYYHLFYQWAPLSCEHKNKCWGHWRSKDLITWQHQPIALLPDEFYDKDGCYSGSAVINQGQLTLCYTGNVKFDDGSRTAWQCLAVENQQGGFDKLGPVLGLPEGYSGHVRDPKIWQHNDKWYMVLGAQTLDKQGKVLLYRASHLYQWQLIGELAGSHLGGLDDVGYMWECPDLFELSGHFILLTCPQGIKKEQYRFLNSHSSAYLMGSFDYSTLQFQHGDLIELDAGFEFYAPQTTQVNGRRLLFGWMGVPDGEEMYQPTIANGWIHQMTCPRELQISEGQLYQQPVKELQQLRQNVQYWQGIADDAPEINGFCVELEVELIDSLLIQFSDSLELTIENNQAILKRRSVKNGEWQSRFWSGDIKHLQILCDSSSVEIFFNHGLGVMSSRFFPSAKQIINFSGKNTIKLTTWQLNDALFS
ncbi:MULTISPECIES: sucrose-6-phosphate hydrolase [Proteus]|uniref:sucrose-6-phosphate hydrolase n=1 Tax=Proteus TaxID=583 RepID=UPI000C7A8168|nr:MULTISPECIES: sucrose-6-phosphate hydrolase [Proteus]MBG2976133.1 sucrose-6-phosphate hydrolase [Proteus mirabilis]MBG3093994.1 sucrose-6-phosphate hydrolase [Proteus mirabilis]MBI6215466.1 sucrose-6-phosphate hydrolase [Proteus vulgaris]MBI6337421.1 sucrose-6-phosphate hydrolase [Proteus sp. PR00224]PLB11130.1 sucrose-6-phosphate hydrolase [Proteus mirabilis]